MKKGYLKLLILIFFAMIIFSGDSYGIELKPMQKENAVEPVAQEKEEPEKKGTVILFTIDEVAKEEDSTEQAEDCSAISDEKNEEPVIQEEKNENNEPIIRKIKENSYGVEVKDNSEIKLADTINKIISKLYVEAENIKDHINVSNDKREKRRTNVEKLTNLVIKPINSIGKTMKNNLLYIQKYADNQEYNRLSC